MQNYKSARKGKPEKVEWKIYLDFRWLIVVDWGVPDFDRELRVIQLTSCCPSVGRSAVISSLTDVPFTAPWIDRNAESGEFRNAGECEVCLQEWLRWLSLRELDKGDRKRRGRKIHRKDGNQFVPVFFSVKEKWKAWIRSDEF